MVTERNTIGKTFVAWKCQLIQRYKGIISAAYYLMWMVLPKILDQASLQQTACERRQSRLAYRILRPSDIQSIYIVVSVLTSADSVFAMLTLYYPRAAPVSVFPSCCPDSSSNEPRRPATP